jgi:hypothetical protein
MAVIDAGPVKMDLLRIRAGDRNLFTIKLSNNSGPIDITDFVIEAQVRTEPTDGVIAISAVIAIVDAAQGQFSMRWPGDDVRDLLAGADTWEGVWDLQVTESVGEDPQTLLAGLFTAESDVTRSP